LSISSTENIPVTAILVFNNGAYGGAPKRYTNLFLHLNNLFPGKFYFIVNRHLFNQLHEMYDELPEDRIKVIELVNEKNIKNGETDTGKPRFYADSIPDPMEVDKQYTIIRKIYWFYKNKYRQYDIYKKIEKIREELNIKIFYGVFSGILPLVFYLDKTPREAAVIFSDMDSWFSEVHTDIKKLWYRKYYSFNYALENCDVIDFLSPYIYEGVKQRGVKLSESSVHISPNSFIDYSKCSVGDKKIIGIAFCSRLEPDKNPLLYLEAAKEILNKYPAIKFHILGEGTLVNEIKDFIDSNNISSSVNFKFYKNPPEIFKNTSIFVSLQSNTNYPSQSVLEAMACGNAIVSSNRGDTNLFIDESNGILIDLNKEELVASITKLIENPSHAHELGIAGRDFVLKNHTIEKYSNYFLNLLIKHQ
jgi:glycosyltransferase involved in cell wall biosynthesis